MKTNLLQLKRKHPKWFYFLYRDELLHRLIRRAVAKSRKRIAKSKDAAWSKQDRDMYDFLTMMDGIVEHYFYDI